MKVMTNVKIASQPQSILKIFFWGTEIWSVDCQENRICTPKIRDDSHINMQRKTIKIYLNR